MRWFSHSASASDNAVPQMNSPIGNACAAKWGRLSQNFMGFIRTNMAMNQQLQIMIRHAPLTTGNLHTSRDDNT